MRRCAHCLFAGWVAVAMALVVPVQAGVASKAARETAEWLASKLGREATEEGVELLARRLDNLASRYGDEVFDAVRKSGMAGLRTIESAGALGRTATRVLARYGDEGLLLARNADQLRLVAEFGDEAAEALVKHGDVAAQVIRSCGEEGAQAMARLSQQNGRRLAMVIQDELWKVAQQTGKQDELLAVIRRWGDEAMDFIWRHKGSLAVAAVLYTFLKNPEAYINGALELPKTTIETVGKETNWTLLFALAMVLAFLYFVWTRRRRRANATQQ